MAMKHSVVLDSRRCRGCTSCIKGCPTEAIRVRGRKATILPDRCIDCGECIRICPHKAIKSVGDSLDVLSRYEYCVALPEPALYGQFHNLDNIDIVLNALLEIGFHKVYEVAKAAEMLSDFERQCICEGPASVTPLISSSCPTVLRLIRMRFPKLMGHVACTILPMELAAILARREAAKETGLPPERIGVFAIVPCSSKVTAARESEGLSHPVLDGAFAIRDIYLRLLSPMKHLETVEPEADFLELSACTQGCVGGCFTVENPYAAKMRLKSLMKGQPVSRNRFRFEGAERDIVRRDKELQYLPTFVLDQDLGAALNKQLRIQELESHLPGLHCGSCGAPSCHAFAEDVILGRATVEDCIFKVRERMRSMAGKDEADDYLPPPFRRCQPEPSNK